ncbi:hypothetical protein [Iningainema tapete]|uniref:Uncharacterized protein n=1 Tax=Iningainema tapete BLCC-T55 TaxID=2748662 RepID=A0A8J7BY68_9CYAN|nr:hypothetical protein [Iningainema tapete]MBD2773778.1 hypothetical protein [Iningainema tapete BLCC-T55]
MRLLWDEWEAANQEIEEVASKFIFANCYNSQFACIVLQAHPEDFSTTQYQVSESKKPQDFVEKELFINLHNFL